MHRNHRYLGDNCIVFENLVANWAYWQRVSGSSKRICATNKSPIDAEKVSNTMQLSPF